jgi:hypothetical protein
VRSQGRPGSAGQREEAFPQVILHSIKLIDDGQRREDVATLLHVSRLHRALEKIQRN